MIKPEFIRPVPKYILERIRKADLKQCPEQKGACRFYSYLTKMKGELVKITVAARNYHKQWYHKQVAVHGVQSSLCWVRDMEYIYFGMGFRVGWYVDGLQKHKKWFEDGNWYSADCRYYNPWSDTVNPEYVGSFPEFKHSAYQYFNGHCMIEYLKLYKRYPQTEYLLKSGLCKLYSSVTILNRIAKDKAFCKWLVTHKKEIADNACYVWSVMEAYKTGKSIRQLQMFAEYKKNLEKDGCFLPIKELFGNDLERFFSYLDEQDSNTSSYLDYLRACEYLGLDMTLPKNRIPHNFQHWHDVRIDQYYTAKAEADEKERAEFYAQFAAVANKYAALQNDKNGVYAVIIAASPAELMHEGRMLDHCVGKMNYDKKMVREDTLIFFVRDMLKPDVPFVTVEYSLKTKKVLQCYGYKSKAPDDTVTEFVHKVWLPYANRKITKILKGGKGGVETSKTRKTRIFAGARTLGT